MDDAAKLQTVFQTLGDANRLRIIKFIGERECSVSEIVQATGLSQPLVSHHLKENITLRYDENIAGQERVILAMFSQ